MLDLRLRRLVDPLLDRVGRWLARRGIDANALSLLGLAIGLLAVPLLALQMYAWALLPIIANRVLDGLDGAIARAGKRGPFGGYLDIVCDMAFYAAVPLGFALAEPGNALWAAALLATFVCTCASFLGRAVLAAGRDGGAGERKSFFHAPGLIEGSETILAFILFCALPAQFPWLAGGFAALCLVTAVARVGEAWRATRCRAD